MLPPHRPFRDKPARLVQSKKKNNAAVKLEVHADQVPRLKPRLVVLANSASTKTVRL